MRNNHPTVWPILSYRDPRAAIAFLGEAFGFEGRAAGAQVVRGLVDEDYGTRGFTVRDPEGNLWSFGTFTGD